MKATRLLNVIIPATLLALFALAGTTLPAAEETSAPEFLWHPVAQKAERDPGAPGGLRDMVRWCEALERPDRAAHYRQLADELTQLVARYFEVEFAAGGDVWTRIGYHRAALGLRLEFFPGERGTQCVAAIKQKKNRRWSYRGLPVNSASLGGYSGGHSNREPLSCVRSRAVAPPRIQ